MICLHAKYKTDGIHEIRPASRLAWKSDMHCSCIASIVNGNKVSYCAFSICVLEEKERKRDVQRGPGRKAIFRTTAKDRKSIYVRSVWKLMICLQDRGTLSHLEPRLPAPLGPMMQVNFLRTREGREASVLRGSCYNDSMSTRHISDVSNCFCRRSNSVCWTIVTSFQLAISNWLSVFWLCAAFTRLDLDCWNNKKVRPERSDFHLALVRPGSLHTDCQHIS